MNDTSHHVKIHSDAEEEGETRCKGIDGQAGLDARSTVFDAVRKGEAKLQCGRGTSLLHVVTRDANRVEFRHVLQKICLSDHIGMKYVEQFKLTLEMWLKMSPMIRIDGPGG